MSIATGRKGTIAALLGFAALAISGTAAGASNSAASSSTAARAKACQGMVRSFQSDVVAAASARGAREATNDAAWQGVALRAASDWLRSGCFSITPHSHGVGYSLKP